MVETRHIKLDYENALNAKKEILSTELNVLHTIKKIRNYRLLRKKELRLKSKLASEMRSLKSKLNQIKSTFPEQKELKLPKIKIKKTKNTEVSTDVQSELKKIQKELERLQQKGL